MHYPHPIEIAARRRRIALMIASVVLVLAFIVYSFWPTGPNGPYYQGRALTSWLQDYANPIHNLRNVRDLRKLDSAFSRRFKDAEHAVKEIGTNALPTLLQLIQARDSGLKKFSLGVVGNQSSLRDYMTSAKEKRDMAFVGFMLLQKDALPAVPQLRVLTKNNDPDVRMRAFDCLEVIESPDSKSLVPVLVSFAHDPDPTNREKAAQYMRLFIQMISPDEAKAAGVYEAFPELKPPAAGAPRKL
jgi:hypothetical protein